MDTQDATSSLAVKQAEGETTPLDVAHRTQLKQDAANYIANLAMASLAVGGLGAGAQGLMGMAQRRKLPYRKQPFRAIPMRSAPTKRKDEKFAMDKKAEPDYNSGDWVSEGKNFFGNTIGRFIYENMLRTDKDNPSVFAGDYATSVPGVPAAWGIGLPLGLAGLYGGYKATGGLISNRRKQELEDELEGARRQYAELSGFTPKTAADEFDELADTMVKQAKGVTVNEPPGPSNWTHRAIANSGMGDILGRGTGLAAAYAILSGLGTGYMGYQWGKKHSRPAMIAEAMKRRQQQRAQTAGGQAPLQFYLEEPEKER